MEYKKIAELVRKLFQKTIDGKLEWEQTDKKGVFQTSFPNYTIRFSMKPRGQDSQDYYISIYDSDGNLVEEVNDLQLEDQMQGSYVLMKEMYEATRGKPWVLIKLWTIFFRN